MILSNELLFLAAEKTALADATGDYARKVVVLVLEEPQTLSNREFLGKVLAAAQLDLQRDTLLGEIPGWEPRAIAPDLQEFKPACLLIFGLTPSQLGLVIEPQAYQPLNFLNCTWLFADKLSSIEMDKAKKTQLWSALKQMFL